MPDNTPLGNPDASSGRLSPKDLEFLNARSRFERSFFSPAMPRPTEFLPNPAQPSPIPVNRIPASNAVPPPSVTAPNRTLNGGAAANLLRGFVADSAASEGQRLIDESNNRVSTVMGKFIGSPAADALVAGKQFVEGRYRLENQIGSGTPFGFGDTIAERFFRDQVQKVLGQPANAAGSSVLSRLPTSGGFKLPGLPFIEPPGRLKLPRPRDPINPQPPGGQLNPPGGAANPKTPTNRDPRDPTDPTKPTPPGPGAPNTNIPPGLQPPGGSTPGSPGGSKTWTLPDPPTVAVPFKVDVAVTNIVNSFTFDGKFIRTVDNSFTFTLPFAGIPLGFVLETSASGTREVFKKTVQDYNISLFLLMKADPGAEIEKKHLHSGVVDLQGLPYVAYRATPSLQIDNTQQPLTNPSGGDGRPGVSPDWQPPQINIVNPPLVTPPPFRLLPPNVPLQPVAPPQTNPDTNPSPNGNPNPNANPDKKPTGNPPPSPSNPPLIPPLPSPNPGVGNPTQTRLDKGWSQQSMSGLNGQFAPPNSSVREVNAKEAEQLRQLYGDNALNQQLQQQLQQQQQQQQKQQQQITLNPTGPDGKLDPSKRQEIEDKQESKVTPNTDTPSKCQDPCIAGIQRKLDDQNDKEKLVKIKVKIFRACKANPQNDDDIAEFDSATLEVRSADATHTKLLYDRLFELEKEKCRSKFEIPETMALKVPDGRPILKITYREIGAQGKVKSSKWVVQVPHYSGGQQGVPKLAYSHGSTQVRYHFPDGSKMVVNAKNETEGKRVVKGLLARTDGSKRKGGKFYVSKSSTDSGEDNGMKPVQLTPTSASFYAKGTGIVDGQVAAPTWTVKLRSQS